MADLFKILKGLKQIESNPEYFRRSRFLILSSKSGFDTSGKIYELRRNWLSDILRTFQPVKLAVAISMVCILILIVISGSFYYIDNQSNQNNLIVKASEINNSIQVKLNEIQLSLKNDSRLNAENTLIVLALLEKATNELKEASFLSLKGDFEESLAKMKSAQDIFSQIESLIKK